MPLLRSADKVIDLNLLETIRSAGDCSVTVKGII